MSGIELRPSGRGEGAPERAETRPERGDRGERGEFHRQLERADARPERMERGEPGQPVERADRGDGGPRPGVRPSRKQSRSTIPHGMLGPEPKPPLDGAQPAHAIGTAPPPAGGDGSPIEALLAATVGRAIGALGSGIGGIGGIGGANGGANGAASSPANGAAAALQTQPAGGTGAPAAQAAAQPQLAPLTPLEQAVHELLSQLGAASDDGDQPLAREAVEPPPVIDGAFAGVTGERTAPASAAAAQPAAARAAPDAPEPPANPSHVHLVIDDGGERVVVTVAVRGEDVNVRLRAGDDATAAALARNAASLDDAMRGRGLQLADFNTAANRDDRDGAGRSRRDADEPDREASGEPFKLEEIE